jgi:hypothetical protein
MPSRGCWMVAALSAQAAGGCHDFIGGRRLRAWEAVVFGEPYVESALDTVIRGGLPSQLAVATEASVAMLIRLEWVLRTLHTSNGR